MISKNNNFNHLLDEPSVLVELTSVEGSTPRETDAFMLVTESGMSGTIGGGQLELTACQEARRFLTGADDTTTLSIPLGPRIGQCCGGQVHLRFSRMNETRRRDLALRLREADAHRPVVQVFGAGHVGKALCQALSLLPLAVTVIDERAAELDTVDAPVEKRHLAILETAIDEAPKGAVYLVLTHDHALDFMLVRHALARGDAAYVGMIGSATKRETFRRWYVKEGGDKKNLADLVCPIGGPSGDKRPEVIAAFVAAEIMARLHDIRTVGHPIDKGERILASDPVR